MKLIKLTLLLFLLNFQLYAQNKTLYVGTYTVNTASEGIYSYNFNYKTGKLTDKTLAVKTTNPSFLALSKTNKYLYSVSESGDVGTVNSYSIQKNNTLNLINSISSNGGAPCHVSLNKSNSKLVVSNYVGGNIAISNVLKNGEIENASQIFNHNITTDKAHSHSAKFYKNNLFAADLGRDYLAHYSKNTEGNYSLKEEILMKDKAGPRHFEISKKGNYIYIINELNSTISVLKNKNGNYNNIQNISTLNSSFKEHNACADIHLSKNQKFIYATNRGENTIVVFKRAKDGLLTKIQSINVKGNWPRNFTLSPNGKFILIANQYSNNICVFKVNKKTGKLNFLKDYKLAAPVCLVF